jgi:hypothetical protein
MGFVIVRVNVRFQKQRHPMVNTMRVDPCRQNRRLCTLPRNASLSIVSIQPAQANSVKVINIAAIVEVGIKLVVVTLRIRRDTLHSTASQ